MKKIIAIIPAYNEQEAIGEVVYGVKKHIPEADVLVINDGSADLTETHAKECGALVISLPYNLGIGGAVQTGYKFAKDFGYDIAIRFDGDGQHNPADADKLIEPIESGRADVVIGSRYIKTDKGTAKPYKASFCRLLGAKFFGFITSCIVRQKIADTTSGFQAVNRSVIEFYEDEYPSDYPEVETIPLLYRAGFRILEVPVSMRQRQAGKTSITPIRSVYYVLKVLLSLFIGLLRKVPQVRSKEDA
ncbi:TPA: glycosyltransferase family 2 protein [Candidatus Poribacteria bacterium]|nr:glycosyltransferase family 2 protein [Candidatus Poribacteria bacterium]